jgi:hypothetical protein
MIVLNDPAVREAVDAMRADVDELRREVDALRQLSSCQDGEK